MSGLFDELLQPLGDKQRDALVAAWAALEYGSQPASEAALPALRDAALRHLLDRMLNQTGRTLVRAGAYLWTSGYRDDIAADLAANGWGVLPPLERAALTLVLIHSVVRSPGQRAAWPGTTGSLLIRLPRPACGSCRRSTGIGGCPMPSSGCARPGWSAWYAAPIPRWPAPPTSRGRRCADSLRPRASACRRT